MRTKGRISREIKDAAPSLGVTVATHFVRSLEAFVDAAQQGSVVTRMKTAPKNAKDDINLLFSELLADELVKRHANPLPGFTDEGLLPPGDYELTLGELASSLLVAGRQWFVRRGQRPAERHRWLL